MVVVTCPYLECFAICKTGSCHKINAAVFFGWFLVFVSSFPLFFLCSVRTIPMDQLPRVTCAFPFPFYSTLILSQARSDHIARVHRPAVIQCACFTCTCTCNRQKQQKIAPCHCIMLTKLYPLIHIYAKSFGIFMPINVNILLV